MEAAPAGSSECTIVHCHWCVLLMKKITSSKIHKTKKTVFVAGSQIIKKICRGRKFFTNKDEGSEILPNYEQSYILHKAGRGTDSSQLLSI